jgi:arylsulfatase A-like enzyme
MFSSDNGAHKEGGHDPAFWDSNGPYRGIKRDLYEGGIHAPMLAWWPGKIEAGSTSDLISAHWDILPTMAALIGAEVPEQCDGISMLPTLLGEEGQKKYPYLYFEFIQGRAKSYTARAIRKGNWKGVQRSKGNKGQEFLPIELYDLSTDVGEKVDLASKKPELVKELEELMTRSHTPLK